MEPSTAMELLRQERRRIEQLLADTAGRAEADRTAANQPGDMFDSAEPLTDEGTDDAISTQLQGRLAAIDRAEKRLAAGTFGLSVRSGLPIPDERLEADPAAELTLEEAERSG